MNQKTHFRNTARHLSPRGMNLCVSEEHRDEGMIASVDIGLEKIISESGVNARLRRAFVLNAVTTRQQRAIGFALSA